MAGMLASGKAGRCLLALQDGPATTGEIASELRLPSKSAGTHLRNLFLRGKVKRTAFIERREPGRRGRGNAWLWEAA